MEAIASLEAGRSVVVCAPTGSGKTVVGEYAIHAALAAGSRLFYTTPLKALSNQKFRDFGAQFGEDRVGLLTGDISINRDAPVVVMTTEVFRNMLYTETGRRLSSLRAQAGQPAPQSAGLGRVDFVVLDECHYINDAGRGTVWEESVICSPRGIQLVALSATIANAERPILEERLAQEREANPSLRHYPYLRELEHGLAVHHAGLLPAWKLSIERLFQEGLIKVVFATETLAAGINMPARTTVISALSKRGDTGYRSLTASEFLQMSGRAGRRGMDRLGHVVVVADPFRPASEAVELASAPPDPLSSRFAPTYGMVLNLLNRFTPTEADALLRRSFGQFLADAVKVPSSGFGRPLGYP